MIYVTYHDGTPENSRAWASSYTYNGELRIKNTSSSFNIYNTDGTIFEEDISALVGGVESSGSLSDKVWNATLNLPSDYAYSISTIPVLLNLGTGQNAERTIVPKNYYSLTIHNDEQTFSYKGEYSFSDFLSLFGVNVEK
jgi:hypothetical protein